MDDRNAADASAAAKLREYGRLVGALARWLLLGSLVGVLAGLSSAAFLWSLEWATRQFFGHPNLLYGLPLADFGYPMERDGAPDRPLPHRWRKVLRF